MHVVLINPLPTGHGLSDATIEPPLGLGYLASMLESSGFPCAIIDAHVLGLRSDEVMARIPPETGLVGISVNSFTVTAAQQLVSRLRKRTSAKIVLGGPYPTAMPEKALRLTGCDGVIRGEGEFAIVRMAENCDQGRQLIRDDVPGSVAVNAEGICVARPVERIDDLNALPFPAYHLMPPLRRYTTRSRKTPVAPIITSRGCAYGCSFCSKDVFQRKVTFRSAQNVLAEIDHLVRAFGVRQIDILDDNVTQDKNRLSAILDGIIDLRYDLALNMQTGIRTELLDKPMLRKMKQAGVFKIAFGIESADEAVLKQHHKQLDLNRVEETVHTARRLGFLVYGFFIIGLPGETAEAFQRTVRFARRMKFDVANFCMALPFPGTDLFRMVERRGRFLVDTTGNIDTGFYGGEPFFLYDDVTAEDIRERYRTAYRAFYSLHGVLRLLGRIRTVSEASWLWRSFLSVVRGMRSTAGNG